MRDHVEPAAHPHHVGGLRGRSVGVARGDDRPSVVLDQPVGEEHLGRVGLDPPMGDRTRLRFQVADGREVDARVGEERATGLGLQTDPVVDIAVARDPRGATTRWRLRTLRSTASAVSGRAAAAAGRAPRGFARRRESASDIDLARRPALPCTREPADRLAKLKAITRHTSTAWRCRPRCAITPTTSNSSASMASRPNRCRSSAGIPGLYAAAASRIETSSSANSVGVSTPRSRAGRGTARGHAFRRDAQPSRTSAISWTLSSVIRHPAATAVAISSGDFTDPFTEIISGGTPHRSAASSSPGPNVSHPVPSSVRIRRSASVMLALIDGRSRTSPSGQAR